MIQAKPFFLKTQKTAAVYQCGNPRYAKKLFIVLHGYGQRADDFLEKFHPLEHKNNVIIAPEGLNHFYTKGGIGSVGATWMTSRHREYEIKDYIAYLEQLLKEILSQFTVKPQVYLIGFSQGTATALRWAVYTKRKFIQVILWSGSVAPDINWLSARKKFSKNPLTLVYGKADEIFPVSLADKDIELLKEKHISYKVFKHRGKHEVLPETLIKLFAQQ